MSARPSIHSFSTALALALAAAVALGCGSDEPSRSPAPATPEPAAPPAAEAPESDEPADLPRALVLSLAQFVKNEQGRSVPGPARLEFLYREDGEWKTSFLEDPESNVFHKAMAYPGPDGPVLLSMAGTTATVKTWRPETPGDPASGFTFRTEWQKDFGGKFSRMRDAEIADLYGDGTQAVAVATHDQGVVAILRPTGDGGFSVEELDQQADTFVHEIEIGDVNADGALEVYATPSEPNRLDGTPQHGEVVRYVPSAGEGRVVVADLGSRHAKEILVSDVDGDGTDELYVSVEGELGGPDGKQLVNPVEIRRYDADTPADAGRVIATIDDRLCRFLTAGDVDGDGRRELVAAAYKRGVWLLRPGEDPDAAWEVERIDADSGGFEHAALLTDLDGDGADELYVASDDDKELRRYRWNGERLERDTPYVRPDDRPVFTWNLMPVPLELVPRG